MSSTARAPRADLSRTAIVIPVGHLSRGKSRLSPVLTAIERRRLVYSLLRHTISATRRCVWAETVIVVSPDADILAEAALHGTEVLQQVGIGLNPALQSTRMGLEARGITAMMIVPIDLPNISPVEIDRIRDAALALPNDGPVLVIVGDRAGWGTNLILVSPIGSVDFTFGRRSLRRHVMSGDRHGARVVELSGPLSFDVDRPDDLDVWESLVADSPEPGLLWKDRTERRQRDRTNHRDCVGAPSPSSGERHRS